MGKLIDWAPIRNAYIEGQSEAAICEKFNINYRTFRGFIAKENLKPLRQSIVKSLSERDVGLVNQAPVDLTPSQLAHTKSVWIRRQIAVLDMQLALLEKELSEMNSGDLPALTDLSQTISMLSQVNALYRKLYDVDYSKQVRGPSSGYLERTASETTTDYDAESQRIAKIEETVARRVTEFKPEVEPEIIDAECEVIDG